jgi:phytoene synthase
MPSRPGEPSRPLSRPGEIVRRHDLDRFLATLFAPAEARETLFTLYAFNHEIARARETVREPTLALVRLQWWREVVEGERRAHEVATPLGAALDTGRLDRGDLLAMVDGREAEIGGDEAPSMVEGTVEDWRGYVLATAGGVAVAAARALGAGGAALDTARLYGAAYGAAGILRHRAALVAAGRAVLPPAGAGEPGAVLAREGRRWLAKADAVQRLRGGCGRVPRRAVSAVLTASLARRDLRRGEHPARPRGVTDQLAIAVAALSGAP